MYRYMEVFFMAEFTKDTVIADVLKVAPDAAPVFLSIGMHCLGCAMASGETIEQACAVHGVDVDSFLDDLNAFAADRA